MDETAGAQLLGYGIEGQRPGHGQLASYAITWTGTTLHSTRTTLRSAGYLKEAYRQNATNA